MGERDREPVLARRESIATNRCECSFARSHDRLHASCSPTSLQHGGKIVLR
jgi:hypothetical protein